MDKVIVDGDVVLALRKLADAIESGKANDASARCKLEMQEVGALTPHGFVPMGVAPTGNVLMTVTFKPGE